MDTIGPSLPAAGTTPESPPFGADQVEETVVARFARIVGCFPHRAAVRWAGAELTYAELDRRSDTIAAHLPSGADQVAIALLFEQGADVIAALLAVLKSGNIYVPPVVSPTTATLAEGASCGLHPGWRRVAPSGIAVHEIPGPHEVLTDPYLAMLAEHVRGSLAD